MAEHKELDEQLMRYLLGEMDEGERREVEAWIARGEDIEILPEHLTEVQTGWRSRYKRCGNCGFETQEDYEYCPKCGRKF